MALRAAQSNGAGRVVVVILMLVAIALAAVLAYRLFRRGSGEPVEALRTTEQALATLRFDDRGSQEKAVIQIMSVLQANPELPQALGASVIASAVRFDDVQGELQRATSSLTKLKNRNEASARVRELEVQIASRQQARDELRARLVEGLAKLEARKAGVESGSPGHLALLRAEGLANSVLGEGEALTLAEAFRQRFKANDDWADLIEPEFALNGGTSQKEAIAQLRALRERGTNSTFLRPYLLLARLQLMVGEPELAREELEKVISMNSRHEIARELLAELAAP